MHTQGTRCKIQPEATLLPVDDTTVTRAHTASVFARKHAVPACPGAAAIVLRQEQYRRPRCSGAQGTGKPDEEAQMTRAARERGGRREARGREGWANTLRDGWVTRTVACNCQSRRGAQPFNGTAAQVEPSCSCVGKCVGSPLCSPTGRAASPGSWRSHWPSMSIDPSLVI